MKKWIRYLAGVVAVTALLAVVSDVGAETCKLEMKKVDTARRMRSRQDQMFRYTSPQHFFQQIGGPQGMVSRSGDKDKPEFSKVIKKEPAKYVAEYPFRGVAKLGSQHFGFVLDAAPPTEVEEKKAAETKKDADKKKPDSKVNSKKKPSLKPVIYSRLYFDINHNGDLTDDKVIEAESSGVYGKNYSHSSFPRTDLTIEVDGKKIDYAFTMRANMNAQSSYSYINASLNAAAYREGEITLDGKKYRVVVVDFNSNGMFNDESKVNKNIHTPDGVVYPSQGDMLYLIDPKAGPPSGNPYDPSGNDALHYVGKLVNIDGRYHDLSVSPVGNELKLTPSSIPVGYVTNRNKGYRAVVYGKQGFLKVIGDKDGKSSLPEGEWKLLSYTIQQIPKPEPKKPKVENKEKAKDKAEKKSKAESKDKSTDKAPEKTPNLFALIADAFKSSMKASTPSVGPSTIAARATRDYKAVKVSKDKTVELPFGPPYRPVVKAQYPQGAGKISLSMSLVGMADEICSSLSVNGRQPGKPKFTITTEDGKEVESGAFEYG